MLVEGLVEGSAGAPEVEEADEIERAEAFLRNAAALFDAAADRSKDQTMTAIICAGQEKFAEGLKLIATYLDRREATTA